MNKFFVFIIVIVVCGFALYNSMQDLQNITEINEKVSSFTKTNSVDPDKIAYNPPAIDGQSIEAELTTEPNQDNNKIIVTKAISDYKTINPEDVSTLLDLYEVMIEQSSPEVYELLITEIEQNGIIKSPDFNHYQWPYVIAQGFTALAFSIENESQFERAAKTIYGGLGDVDNQIDIDDKNLIQRLLVTILGNSGNSSLFKTYTNILATEGTEFQGSMADACYRYDWTNGLYKVIGYENPRNIYLPHKPKLRSSDGYEGGIDHQLEWLLSVNQQDGLMSEEVQKFLLENNILE